MPTRGNRGKPTLHGWCSEPPRYYSEEIRDKAASYGIYMSKMVQGRRMDLLTGAIFVIQQTCKRFRGLARPTLAPRKLKTKYGVSKVT